MVFRSAFCVLVFVLVRVCFGLFCVLDDICALDNAHACVFVEVKESDM